MRFRMFTDTFEKKTVVFILALFCTNGDSGTVRYGSKIYLIVRLGRYRYLYSTRRSGRYRYGTSHSPEALILTSRGDEPWTNPRAEDVSALPNLVKKKPWTNPRAEDEGAHSRRRDCSATVRVALATTRRSCWTNMEV